MEPQALPGWLTLGWKLISALSSIDYLQKNLSGFYRFCTSPLGNILLILGGLAWLAFVVFRPTNRSAETSGSVSTTIPLEDQIYIHIPAVATAVIGDQASTRVSFFSAQKVRLTYCKVKFARGEASFTLENAQPMNIDAFRTAEQNLARSLTTDEQERIGQTGRGQILHYEGLAIFGHIEKPFWGMVVEHF